MATTTLSLILLTAVTSLESKRVPPDWGRVVSTPAAAGLHGGGGGGSSVREFCDWETANATCLGRDEVVVVRSARYGRLRLNRCALL